MNAGARAVSARVLLRVADEGAYAAPTLDAELSRAGLDARDRALATEIVYGTLRVLPELDALLECHLKRPLRQADGFVRAVLRTSAYQLRHLSRVAEHGIVHQAVGLARSERGDAPAHFVNAVLRKLAADRPVEPRPPNHVAVPEWLYAALQSSLGSQRGDQVLDCPSLPPPVCLRANPARIDREALVTNLERHLGSGRVRAGSLSPHAVLLERSGNPRTLPGYAEGHFTVQEEGAQMIALALDARPTESVVDACAGRGGKTTLLMQCARRVTAVDLDERKLERIAGECDRLGIDRRHLVTHAVDLSVGTGALLHDHDAVLVDAPCTGTGTLRRRPELLLRLDRNDPERMGELQARILVHASKLVRPGGRLVYAVCSVMDAEGAGVRERFEAEVANFDRLPVAVGGLRPDPDAVLRIGPWSVPQGPSAPDGYQLMAFRRRG